MQKYSIKLSQTKCKNISNNNPSCSSRMHPRHAEMVKYKEINQINPLYKKTQRNKNHMNISLDGEKAFDKIQHPFIVKDLERSEIQGPYQNIAKQCTANQHQTQWRET